MCGRFINITNAKYINKIFDINQIKNFSEISYNISPKQNINVILIDKGYLILDSIKWGYSFYNKYINKKQLIINSRLETINSKILFKESFLNRKCIVLSNGYIEWKFFNNEKYPYFINLPDKELIYFAAIWRLENNNTQSACCIITKEANNEIKNIHNRMPIIFSYNEALKYLEDNNNEFCNNVENLEVENNLEYYRISKKINNPTNNYKECLDPIN